MPIAACAALTLAWPLVHAESPRHRRLGLEQGLPHPRVERIVSDSRGLLWFCTADTVSAYDGAGFLHFPADWGGGEREMHDVAEAPDGRIWVASWRGGLAVLDPDEPAVSRVLTRLETAHPKNVRRLVFDDRGRLWIGTGSGLLRVDDPSAGARAAVRRVDLRRNGEEVRPAVWDLEFASDGRLWIATDGRGVFALDPHTPDAELESLPCLTDGRAFGLARDADGHLWVGHGEGVVRCGADGATILRVPRDRLNGEGAVDVFVARDGAVWIAGARRAIHRWTDGELERVDVQDASDPPRRFAEDVDGNVWLGTMTGGAHVFDDGGLRPFSVEEGLRFSRQAKLALDGAGRPVVSSGESVYSFEGERFVERPLAPLAGQDSGSMTDNAAVFRDSRSRWWIGARRGLFVSEPGGDGGPHTVPLRPFSAIDPAADGRITTIAESPEGEIWLGGTEGLVAVIAPDLTVRTRTALRRTGTIRRFAFSEADAWIVGTAGAARADRTASDWTEIDAFREKRPYDARIGPEGSVYVATRGHGTWVRRAGASTDRGFERIEAIPDGLTVRCLEFDGDGRLYLGTQTGLFRFDPTTGDLRRFTVSDGLSSMELYSAMRDGDGRLWFSTERGVTRYDPARAPVRSGSAPEPRILDVRINGRSNALPPLGAVRATGLRAPPGPASIEVDLSAVSFDDAGRLGFQYRTSAGDDAWSRPTGARTLTFAGLGAGRHRLEFRSTMDGAVSSTLAAVELRVLAPLWKRPWFLALLAAVALAVAATVLRSRWEQLKRLQAIRLRLATDLHDEVGSGLSQVSILSEMARRRTVSDPSGAEPLLRRIGDVARDLVDSMGEIVWAINPELDTAEDLTQRMRRFASDVLENDRTRVAFETRGWRGGEPLGPRLRRELFLMLKECVHNVAKHAEAANVSIVLAREGRNVRLRVEDDGRGFDPDVETTGLGRPGIADRARRLGGSARFETSPGGGTTVEIVVPFARG